MPLSVTDAERTLNLLWEFKQYVEDEESDTSLNAAISLLTGYCTEILPVITKNGINSAVVELECSPGEKLGICLDAVTAPLCSHSLIMINLIKPASVSDKSGLLKAGDQVIKINGHSLTGATLRRARWLLETAQRSGKAVIEVISSALKSNLKHSRTLPPSPFTALEPPPAKRSKQGEPVTVTAEVENEISFRQSSGSIISKRSSSSSLHNHPSYAPSIGSRRSSQVAVTSTVEVAAHIAREQTAPSGLLGKKRRKVHKIHMLKGKRPLGLSIIGGKGSKYGDVGIFIKDILVDGAAYRDGRLKINDELLMVNARSLVGLTHNEADLYLQTLPAMVQLVVATESMHASGQTSLCSSRFSLSSIQEKYVQSSVSPLVTHAEHISPIESVHDSATESAHDSAIDKALNTKEQIPPNEKAHNSEKSRDATTDVQHVPHLLLDTDANEEDGISSPKQKTFTTNLKQSEIPITANELESQFHSGVTMGKRKKISSDNTDFAPKKEKEKSSSGTFKVLKLFKKNRSKANVHAEKHDDNMELAELEMSLGKSLEESETASADDEHKYLSPSGMSGDLEMVTPWARLSSSNIMQPNNMPPSPPVKTIVIPRSQNKKLGIALGQSRNESGPPFVKSLDPDGLAAKDGRISVGNVIMKVNNEPLANRSAKDAALIIRTEFAKYGMVSLMISKGRKPQTSSTCSIVKGGTFTVLLTNDPKFGFGVELAQLSSSEGENNFDIVIQKVTSTENAQHVQRGDQILEVNGLSIVGITIDNVDEVLKRIKPGMVPFKLLRPTNLTAVISELDKLSKESKLLTSPLVNSCKEDDNIESNEIIDVSHTEVSDIIHQDSIFKSLPSSVEPSSSVSKHGNTSDSDKASASSAKTPESDLKKSKVTSSFENGINMSTEDILRRLHRHPSLNTIKREMITFDKGSGRMGIEVVAGGKTPHKGALVIQVFPDCVAGIEGKLRCGDEILEVNGRSIIGMCHSEVINILKECQGLVTMFVSRSSQVLNSHSGSETSLLDDFYATEKLNSAAMQNSLDDFKSSGNISLHSIRQEEFSEDELDNASPADVIQQVNQGSNDNVITIRYSDSSIFSTGHRTSVIYEESLPPLPTSSPPVPDNLSVGSSTPVDKELKETEEDGPPIGHTVVTLEIQKISKGKLTIVSCQKIREGYFMVRRVAAGSLKDGSIKPGDILVSLNETPLYGIPHAQVLQNLNEAPKQSKLEIYRDPDYKLDSVYTPRASYCRASYTGSRSSLVSTDDSPQLESRGSFTDFGTMSNRGSPRRSRRKLPVAKRSSEGYEFTNSLKRYSSQEAIKQRPSSLSNFTSVSSLVAKRSSSSAVPPLVMITPKASIESSPVTSHHSTPSIEYPVNTLPSSDGDIQEAPLVSADATNTVAGKSDDVPMYTLGEGQVEKTNSGSANEAVTETTFMEQKKKLSPVTFGSRNKTGPFEIEVTKGFWGLGVTVDCNKTGAIFVKALTSRSPFSKDGNIKVGDHILSINDEPVKSLAETEQTLKRLPKGPVKIVAMPPPTNVTNDDQIPPINVTTNNRTPPTNVTNDDQGQHTVSPTEDALSDKGIITVEFNCPKSVPLGLNIAGGSDMAQKLVYIHSITPGSLADRCNKLKVGDEIVMVGNDLMVGLTWRAASDKINQLVGSFKIVAQRRDTVVAKLEEKQQKEMKQNGSDSFDGNGDKTTFWKKELLATPSTNDNSQHPAAVAAAAQLHTEDTETNGATASVHPEQQSVMSTDHTDGDESITFTVKLNRPKNTPLGLNITGGSDMLQKVIYIHSVTPGSPADKCNKFQPGDEIVTAGNTTMAGLTWKAASAKFNKLAGTFKIVVKRRSGSREQQKDQSLKTTATALEPTSTAPPEPPSNAPPKSPSSPPTKDIKLARSVSVDSFDSESEDEFLLQQENGVPQSNIPLQIAKPARTISLDSFDSESGDEELRKEETLGIPPKLPHTVPPELPPSIPPELPPALPPELPPALPPEPPPALPPEFPPALPPELPPALPPELPPALPPEPPPALPPEFPPALPPELPPALPPEPPPRVPPTIPPELPPRAPPEPLTSAVTKPAHAISMDSFDSESDDESSLEQEETLGAPPDPPSSIPPDNKKLAHTVLVNSSDSESGNENLSQQEILGVPPEPSSAPPKPPPRVPPESQQLNGARATALHQQSQSHSFDNESSDELQLLKEKIHSSGTQLSSAAKLSKNSINSESDDELSFINQEETFTVTFNKDANLQLGISIKEEIDTTHGVGVRAIIKGSLVDQDGRLQPGNKLVSVNGISLCGLTHKKILEVLKNAGNQLKIVATRPAAWLLKKSITQGSSIDELSETSDSEEPAEAVKVGEEMFTVEFHKKENHKLGVTITGGIDTPTGDVGVKNIVKGSLADIDGRLQQGNKLLSVNGISLSNVTNKKALDILRGAGNHITIVAVRYVGVDKLKGTPLSSAVPSLTSSRNQSPRASRKALHDPLPEIPSPRRKMSKHFQPGRTAKKSTSSLHESGHHTLPRDFGKVKAVELRKGPQGLGMQLIGGIDKHMPVTVKEVFTGGAAQQSSKIRQGDQILEINGKSFAQLTHREVIELIKNEPEGKATLLVKSASRNK